jgi:4-amino-4-deoxy-L-arabinose transferase-like glycosyltransferase
MRRGTALGLCAGAVAAGSVLRLHFLHVPLVTDEGGYATIARLWSQGYRLYGSVAWVDRPQALLILYRIAGLAGSAAGFRTLALVAAAVTTCAVAAVAWALAGRLAGVLAAFLYALVSPAPHIEGFTANGELLAGAFAATACAAAAWWLRERRPWLLVAAGLAAGTAPLVKQSAVDGLAVLAAAILIGGSPRGRSTLIALAAALVTPALAVTHALVTGFHAWWWAIAGYRSTTESVASGDTGSRVRLFFDSIPGALEDLPLLLVFGAVGAVAAARLQVLTLPLTWLVVGFLGLLAGGLYHPHYWVQLVPPLAVLAGIGADRLASRPLVLAGLAACGLAVTLLWSAEVYATGSPNAVSRLTSNDDRIISAPAVGRTLAAETRPGQPVSVLWANAAVYWYANRPPALRYLWYLNVQHIAGAAASMRQTFTGPHPPAAVAVYQSPDQLDPSGTIRRVLDTRYRALKPIDGIPVYVLRQ